MMLNKKSDYILGDEDVVLVFDFVKFVSGDFKALFGDLLALELFPKSFDFMILESDISFDIFFGGVEHCKFFYFINNPNYQLTLTY